MATVTIAERQRNNGKSYIIQYTDPETLQKKYHKSFRHKAEAQAEANKIRSLIDTGEWGQATKQVQNSAMTFGEAVKLCKQEWQAKLDKERLRPAMFQGYLDYIKPVEKEWNKKLLASFVREELELWHVKITKAISPATANRRLFVIKQVLCLSL